MFGKSVAKKDIEENFIRHLQQITPKDKWLAVFTETVLDVWEEKGKSFVLDAEAYEKQLNALLKKKTAIRDLLEDGTYDKETGKERLAEIENQVMAAKISLSEARIEQFDIEGALSYATNFIKDLGRQWFDLPAQLRPRFQRLVFPAGLPYSRTSGFGTAQLGLIYEINRTSEGDLSHVVDPARIELASPHCK